MKIYPKAMKIYQISKKYHILLKYKGCCLTVTPFLSK